MDQEVDRDPELWPEREPVEPGEEQDDQEAERGGPSDVGHADGALLAGDPSLGEAVIALRCPRPGCDRTGSAADWRRAYWPKCPTHRVRMVEVG